MIPNSSEPQQAVPGIPVAPDIPSSSDVPETQLPIALEYGSPLTDSSEKIHTTGTLAYDNRGLVRLFSWLLWGDFAWSMKERSVGDVIKLLLKIYGANDLTMTLFTTTLPQAISLLIAPVISYRSDRHRGRWGRRIPFLLIPTPIAAIAMFGLAYSPVLGRWIHHAGGGANLAGTTLHAADHPILLCLGIFWVIFEISTIAVNSVFSAFVNDVVPRPFLGRFYGMFRAFSLIAGMIFTYFLLGHAKEHYVPIFLGIGLLYALGFTAMCLNVKEGEYPPPDAPAPSPARGFDVVQSPGQQAAPAHAPLAKRPFPLLAVGTYFRECFTKPYYYWVFAAIILPNMAFLPINTFNLYFSQSVNMSLTLYGHLQALYFFFSLLQTVPIGWLADKFGPLRVAMVALVLHASAALWGGLFAHNVWSFGIAYVLTGTFSGTWFTATAALGQVLLPKMKFAQYMSAHAILNSLSIMIFGPLLGRFLDMTHHHYEYTYSIGFLFDVVGMIATVVVYRRFLQLGGGRDYVAPE